MFDSSKPEWLSNWIIIISFTALVCYYKYLTWNYGIFKKLGIKGPKPYPALGNFWQIYKIGITKFDLESKQKYGSVVGSFFGREPILLIYDIDILKQIMIKEFNSFNSRINFGVLDPPMDKMILLLKDDHWRHVRGILSPRFSSGKLRKMSAQINKCCETLCHNLKEKAGSGEVFDIRALCGAFTMDTIASTTFGVEIDSHNDPENAFVRNANKIVQFRFSLSLVIYLFFRFLYKPLSHLGLSLADKSAIQFFINVIQKAIGQRTENSSHVDFLQIMLNDHLEEQNGEDNQNQDNSNTTKITKGLTNDELIAQGFMFFLAGYDTTANMLAIFSYCMAINPDIQEKLHAEIFKHLQLNEELTYDSIKNLTYLDMCLSETLRMYPAGPRSDRVAGEDITINGLFIPKGMIIGIPIYALQNDPEYWNEPQKFDPERFAPSVKNDIDPFRYMPFGAGPRNCIGMRLALLEIKMAIIKMMSRFEFRACKETEIPLDLDPMAMKGKNGIKIKVVER